MSKKVTFRKIGHACFMIEADGQAILFDPWFGAPINHGTFHAVPEMVPPSQAEIAKLVAIHVSHIHDDHFDLATVAQLPKNIPVVIGKSQSSQFRDRIAKQGFTQIIELEPGVTGFQIGPFGLTIYPKFPTDLSFDSSIAITVGNRNFYVGNDCIHPPHFYSQMRHTLGTFEGGFIGHTIVNPVLWCADFSECGDYKIPMRETTELVVDRQAEAWHHVQYACKALGFDWYSPYSSEFRFLNRDLLHHNALFCEPTDAYKIDLGKTKPILLDPGETFEGISDARMRAPLRMTRDEIPADRVLPNWVDLHCGDVDLSAIVAQAGKYFEDVLRRQPKIWTSEILIELRIHEDVEWARIQFEFDGERWSKVEKLREEIPDMIVEYPAKALGEVFKGRWNLPALHRFFIHKVRYTKMRFAPMGVLTWS